MHICFRTSHPLLRFHRAQPDAIWHDGSRPCAPKRSLSANRGSACAAHTTIPGKALRAPSTTSSEQEWHRFVADDSFALSSQPQVMQVVAGARAQSPGTASAANAAASTCCQGIARACAGMLSTLGDCMTMLGFCAPRLKAFC